MLLVDFKSDALKPLTGKTLAEVARLRGKSPEETIMDLVLEDQSRIGTIYFLMSDDNLKKEIQLPWVSFASDAGSIAAEGVFLKSSAHPRAYGSFARVLGKYVRDEHVISLPEAIRKLAALPSDEPRAGSRAACSSRACSPTSSSSIRRRSPTRRRSRSRTRMPSACKHVFVNGVQVLKDGEHTGQKPGRALWGPGRAH